MTEDGWDEPAAAPERQSLDRLCQEILERHHAYAHIAVPRIRGRLASLLEHEPGAVHPALPAAFGELAELLVSHLAKEENILFPALAAMADAERIGGARPPEARQRIVETDCPVPERGEQPDVCARAATQLERDRGRPVGGRGNQRSKVSNPAPKPA